MSFATQSPRKQAAMKRRARSASGQRTLMASAPNARDAHKNGSAMAVVDRAANLIALASAILGLPELGEPVINPMSAVVPPPNLAKYQSPGD